MASSYTTLLGLVLPVQGELQGTWGDAVNNELTSLLDTAIAGTTTLSSDADVTLTDTDGIANQARQQILLWTANGTVTRNITAPAQSKTYIVINKSAGTQSIVLRGVGPTTGVTVLKDEQAVVAWNGSDFVKVSTFGGSPSFTNVTITGTTALSGLTASTALALDASKNVVSVVNTGTGGNVLATSPTLVTPILGTPQSVTLTNATGLPLSTGVTGTLPVANGGTGASVASTARTNLGATTLGANLFTITNPGAITFPRFNADNSVSSLNATDFRTAIGAGTGNGTVTSVGATSPVASSGGTAPTISLNSAYGDTLNPYGSKTANFVLAAPNGSPGVPSFRAIVAADIPTLNQNTTGTASNVTGTVAIANGGTGATTAQAAINALAASTTSGQYLRGNGSNVVMSAIQVADVPTLNQNTTGTASNVTGTVAVANGGTGATTAATARANLDVPTRSGGDASGTWNINITGNAGSVSGTIAIANGGTGATSAADARTNLDVPTRTGGDASGTWGINVTGNAGSASSVAWTNVSGRPTDLSSFTNGPGYITSSGIASNVSGTVAIANGGTGATTAAIARTNFDVPTRTGGDASGTWGINITGNAATATNGLTTGNYNSYAPTLTGGNASGTWGINITGNAGSASSVAWTNVSSKPTLATYKGTYTTAYLGDGALGVYTYDIAYSTTGTSAALPIVSVSYPYWVRYGAANNACTVTLNSMGWYKADWATAAVFRIAMNVQGAGNVWPYSFTFNFFE